MDIKILSVVECLGSLDPIDHFGVVQNKRVIGTALAEAAIKVNDNFLRLIGIVSSLGLGSSMLTKLASKDVLYFKIHTGL